MRVAVVGAGVAGLACARRLKAFGHAPLVFDKGKGPAGRMASRRLSTPVGEMAFDLGAQYFTVRSAEFADRVADWVARGVVAPWPEAGADAWTGVPTMSAPLKDLAEGLSIRWRSFVGGLSRGREGWSLHLETGEEGPFDVVVIALPVEQATPLLALNSALFPSRRALSASQPCWAAIYAFDAPLGAASDVIRRSGPIAFAARHGAKPGRTGAEGWVVHAEAEWSAARLERDPVEIEGELLAALEAATGEADLRPIAAQAHRWRFARSHGLGLGPLWDAATGLGVCGDWLTAPRVESAWLSGHGLARMVVEEPVRMAALAEPRSAWA